MFPFRLISALRHEGEEQECGSIASREGECGVPRAGEAAAVAVRDNLAVRQGLNHPTDDVVPQDATSLPRR